jgi:hypothetical protein
MTDADLTGYCGLYCGDCIRFRSRAADLANDLVKELDKTQFSDYARVKQSQIPEFEYYEPMVKLLVRISELRCEVPCRLGGDGCVGSCHIVKCVKDKSFEGCWECPEYETCERLRFLKPFHGDTPLRNLGRIKEFGMAAWAKHRGKCYPWQK